MHGVGVGMGGEWVRQGPAQPGNPLDLYFRFASRLALFFTNFGRAGTPISLPEPCGSLLVLSPVCLDTVTQRELQGLKSARPGTY